MEQDKQPPDEDAKRKQVDDLGRSTGPKQRRDRIRKTICYSREDLLWLLLQPQYRIEFELGRSLHREMEEWEGFSGDGHQTRQHPSVEEVDFVVRTRRGEERASNRNGRLWV